MTKTFKGECTAFLNTLLEMRTALVEQAVNEAIAKEHIPYVAEITAKKDELIAEAKAEYERNVAALAAALQSKINQFNTETETAISVHKTKVTTVAAENALCSKFDSFILRTSELVDGSGIE